MSVAPHAGVIDFGTFTPPTASLDGIQGEVPAPLSSEIGYVLSTEGWVPQSGGGGGTVTSVSGTSPISVATGTTTPAISITQANTTTDGYLSSTDWNTFNSKGSGTVTSVGGTGTVSGISLSGTVTSSGSLTLGGALNLSSPPTIGNTTPNTGAFTTVTTANDASISGLTVGKGGGAFATNTAVGVQSLNINGTGLSNVGVGYRTLFANTSGYNNTVVGASAASAITSGGGNTAIGKQALQATTISNNNTAVGNQSLYTNISGASNTAVGQNSLFTTNANSNVGIGDSAGFAVTSGITNILIGTSAGYSGTNNLTTGSNNVLVGYNSAVSAAGDSNSIVIGANAVGLGSNTTVIGNSSTTSTTLYGSVTAGSNSANYATISGGATTKAVQFQTLGSDANVSLAFQPKGTGAIDLVAGNKGVNISNGNTVTTVTRVVAGTYTVEPIATISAPTTAGGVTATASVTLQLLATSTIAAAGSGYAIGDTITLVGGTSSVTAVLTVATLSGSGVATFTVTTAGIYTVLPTNPISTTSSGAGTGFTLTGSWALTATLPVTLAGSGYVEQPTVTISGGTGSGGTAYASVGAGSIIRTLGASGNQALDFYTAGSITSSLPIFRIRDNVGDSYLMVASSTGSATLTAQGAAGAGLNLFANSGGRVTIGTNSTQTNSEQFRVSNTTTSVNYVQVTGGVTGNPGTVTMSAQGSDANVNLALTPKGTGGVGIGTSNPTARLDIAPSTGAPQIFVRGIGSSDVLIKTVTTLGAYSFGTGVGTTTNCWNIYDNNASAERFRISGSGGVSIGSTTDPGAGSLLVSGVVKLKVFTVATLPAASPSGIGSKAFVSDALAPVFGSTVVTGGAVAVPVYSDGTNWKVG